MEFFKSGDFYGEYKPPNGWKFIIPVEVAELLASSANRLIKERGKVVYTNEDPNDEASTWMQMQYKADHTRALLICVEPIEQDSAEKILRDYLEKTDIDFIEFKRRARALLEKGEGK